MTIIEGEFYQVGKKLGLSQADVDRVLRFGVIFVILGVIVAIITLVKGIPSEGFSANPTDTYPKGTLYGTVSIKDFS